MCSLVVYCIAYMLNSQISDEHSLQFADSHPFSHYSHAIFQLFVIHLSINQIYMLQCTDGLCRL